MDAPRRLPRRNKGFDETHQELIETAVRLISERGTDALSITALAREMGINRTTVYYHFDSREALLAAVKHWAADQLAEGMNLDAGLTNRIEHITRFVLENPDLMKLWIDDFVSGTDIRESYSRWDDIVSGLQPLLGPENDAKVYCVMLLTAAFIGPRVYRNSINPTATIDEIVGKFVHEHQRVLCRDGLLPEP